MLFDSRVDKLNKHVRRQTHMEHTHIYIYVYIYLCDIPRMDLLFRQHSLVLAVVSSSLFGFRENSQTSAFPKFHETLNPGPNEISVGLDLPLSIFLSDLVRR